MTKPPFLSKEIKFKRVVKGTLFVIIFFITFFTIGDMIFNTIDTQYREKYEVPCECDCEKDKQDLVLGEEDEILEPTLLGSYELKADEYIWYWDIYEQGYYPMDAYINIPRRYIFGDIVNVEKTWDLKNNNPLDISCDEIDLTTDVLGNIYKCDVSYNNKLIRDDVRHEAYCFYEAGKNCIYNIGIVVFSNSYSMGSSEYLVTLKYNGQSHNDISVYLLEDGEYKPLPFKYEKDGEHFSDLSYMVSGSKFEMYGVSKYGIFDKFVDGDWEFVTYFSEPTMGVDNNVEGIHTVWKVEDDGLYLRKTVMDLYREEELQD